MIPLGDLFGYVTSSEAAWLKVRVVARGAQKPFSPLEKAAILEQIPIGDVAYWRFGW